MRSKGDQIMPTIEASKKDLEKLIGKKFTDNQLEDALMYVKGEVDGKDGDAIKIDVKETNRPDLWSSEGIAREIKARIGKDKGIKKYKTTKGKKEKLIRLDFSVDVNIIEKFLQDNMQKIIDRETDRIELTKTRR